MSQPKHPCDCCGYRTLAEACGRTGQICPVCFWEDSRWLDEWGKALGGSGVSLETAQENFASTGVCHPDFANATRPPQDDETRDPTWLTVAKKRTRSADALRPLITSAFAGVSRRGGISLREAGAIDDYASAQEQAAARLLDTDRDWTEVSQQDLGAGRFSCVLSFFDPIGYRYHLPAYLMCWLDRPVPTSSVFEALLQDLVYMRPDDPQARLSWPHRERIEVLDPGQRYAVARFIDHLARFNPDGSTRHDAATALGNGWQSVLDAGPPAE